MEKQYIGCDAHRRYSVFVVMDDKGRASKPVRVEHDRSELREYLRRLPLHVSTLASNDDHKSR